MVFAHIYPLIIRFPTVPSILGLQKSLKLTPEVRTARQAICACQTRACVYHICIRGTPEFMWHRIAVTNSAQKDGWGGFGILFNIMLFLKHQIVVMICFYVRVVCTLAISFTALGGSHNGTSGPMNHIG